MVTNDRQSRQRGRTLWDYLHENPWVLPFLIISAVSLLVHWIG